MEKIIKLINEIDKIIEDDYFEDEMLYDKNIDVFNLFSDKLLDIFGNEITDNQLNMILKLDYKNIFKIHNGDKYINNPIRKKIEEYINNNEQLYLDYDLIKQNIKENYKLAKYLQDKTKIYELIELNEKALLYIKSKYATNDFILEQMKKSDFVSLILLGNFGAYNDIYRYSMFYFNNKEINEILYNQLKTILSEDVYKYINASELVKKNKQINELIVSIDPRMNAYIK